ncbi:MAG: MerR family DNA-binding protein [Gammaproteobacteria bacterium]|nr:MerR family DNA-binding protein [Gammaproteobacteria bacterium]
MKTVSQLAKTAKVSAETVRYYSRLGLLEAQRDPQNGYQLFDQQAVQRLAFISQSRSLGFSLKDIQAILKHTTKGDSPCPMVRDMLRQRVPLVAEKIRMLEAQMKRMQQALEQWQSMPDGVPDGHRICHLIEEWHTPMTEVEHHDK